MNKQSNTERLQHENEALSNLEQMNDVINSPVAKSLLSVLEAFPLAGGFVGIVTNTVSSIVEKIYSKKLHALLTTIAETPLLDIPAEELAQRGGHRGMALNH